MPHIQEQKPVVVRTRTRSEKIIIRVIIIGVLLFIVLNGVMISYWYFTRKGAAKIAPPPVPEITEEQTTPEPEGPSVQPPAPPLPAAPAFFQTAQEKTINFGAVENLISLLSGTLKEEYPQGFTRILVRNTENGASLTIQEFFARAGVTISVSLSPLLKDDFMLFIYSSPGRKRLGVIAEVIQTEGVQDILRNWETTLEQDTKPLWEIVGQKGPAYTPFFRQSVHQNTLVRFQTFSVLDFGVVYTLFGTKLILATSFESVTRTVDQIIQSRQ